MVANCAMHDSDNDEVVQELDVYISKALADRLYLLQYPLRPANLSYDEEHCLDARVKPKQHKVELEFALNTHDPSYDHVRGEQFAANANTGSDQGKEPFFQSNTMDKQILTSTRAVTSAENYAVGLLRPGELHLSPLHCIVQMKPSFSYLDQSDVRNKVGETATAEEEEDADEPQAVQVRFAGAETERSKRARERSFHFLQQQQDNEPWTKINFHPFGSEMSSVERAMLLCPQMDRDVSDLPGTPQDYFRRLVIEDIVAESKPSSESTSTTPATVINHERREQSMHGLRDLPLQDQIKAILTSAKVVDFSKLMSVLPSRSDATSVVRFLQQVALLVQGCWVVKSDVLYPKDSFSAVTGVPAETMCRARDYLMWLYTQSRHVVQSKFADTVRLPSEDVKTLLSEMGRLTPSGWEFLLSPDKEFVTRFPDVVQRQQMLWDAKQQFLSKSFKLSRQETQGSQDAAMQSPPPGGRARQPRRRQRSRHDSTASEGSGSETPTSHPKSGANDKADFDLSRVKREPQSPSSKSKAAKADKGLTSPVKPSSNSTH
ncbi:DNA-directed RNA polymerase III subunit RPC5 [Ixodes scapularis]|uniref:DNA-directed RNA polymerase III subunit RPC5 n=1 Tax=Ixodes scapularis TaxID=6945 RepID=UPI001C38F64C|nr:DNA-directed RNA polymerase III subunit RPC5 [Ixodes scapularis]XP_042150623.1 DNA-directed RNA polymerase III subunit RPC5 [Ixodes scapularis]